MRISTLFSTVALLWVALVDAKLVKYTLTITNGTISPDGNPRGAWLINGQTPGPHLVFDEGDQAEIRVINHGFEPTTIHWHGIEQKGTPWSDGVPGLTQYENHSLNNVQSTKLSQRYPISVGQDFIYRFNLTQYGFHWYHSHYKMQMDDGLKGTIFIRPRPTRANPFKQISTNPDTIKRLEKAANNALMFNTYDYKHYMSDWWMSEWKRTGIEQLCVDNILINGRGQVACPNKAIVEPLVLDVQKPLTPKGCMSPNNTVMYPFSDSKPDIVSSKVFYECTNTTTNLQHWVVNKNDKWVAFNLLNSGALWDLRVSVDSHTLYIYAADGNYVRIKKANSITIPLDQPVDDYVVRVAAAVVPQMQSGFGVLSYTKRGSTTATGPPVKTTPTAKSPFIDYVGNMRVLFSETLLWNAEGLIFSSINNGTDLATHALAPYPANPPPQGPADRTIRLNVERPEEMEWTLNGVPWHEHSDDTIPLLFDPASFSHLDNRTHFSYPYGTLVDVIMVINAGNPALHPPHPMHKHSNKAWFLGSGTGDFPYETIYDAIQANYTNINIVNPPYRDDFVTPVDLTGKAWAAFRYRAEDVGPVILHCHIDPHLATGMAVVFMEANSTGFQAIELEYVGKESNGPASLLWAFCGVPLAVLYDYPHELLFNRVKWSNAAKAKQLLIQQTKYDGATHYRQILDVNRATGLPAMAKSPLPTLQLLSHKFKVTALCDVSKLSLQHCAAKFGVSSDDLHENSLDLVKRDDVDLVVVLSGDEYHVGPSYFVDHGVNRETDGVTDEDADSVIAAQKQNNVIIFVGYMRRYAPAFLEAVKIVHNMNKIQYARVRDIIGPVSVAFYMREELALILCLDQNKFFIDQSGTFPGRFDDFSPEFSADRVGRAQTISNTALGAQRAKDSDKVFTYRLLGGLGSHDLSAMWELLGPPKRCIGAGKITDGICKSTNILRKYDGFMTTYETGIDTVGKFDAHLEVYGDGKRVKVTYDTPFVKGLPITLTVSENDPNGHYHERIIRPTYQDTYTCQYEALYDSVVNGSTVKTTPEDAKEDLKIFKKVIDALYPLEG
ncbi:multicopper oxidase family [Rhizoctonia solani]|uniref:Multicopper oxidase family n=1 Tax=Rhizoctonia solani TaxID=456999 RepID=A0A8H7H4E1_9AGAM|nr:multicopper oxidase family [Rhizoctonia solani]